MSSRPIWNPSKILNCFRERRQCWQGFHDSLLMQGSEIMTRCHHPPYVGYLSGILCEGEGSKLVGGRICPIQLSSSAHWEKKLEAKYFTH